MNSVMCIMVLRINKFKNRVKIVLRKNQKKFYIMVDINFISEGFFDE